MKMKARLTLCIMMVFAVVFAYAADVMAYREIDMARIGIEDAEGEISYLLADRLDIEVGDAIEAYPGTSLYEIYSYGDVYGLGQRIDVASGYVRSVRQARVALVHRQVYEQLGFDTRTARMAVPTNEWVNTRLFTDLDRELYTVYAKANGLDESNLDGDDSDHDGINDGWELYMGLDPNDPSDARAISPGSSNIVDACAQLRITNIQEYEGGTDIHTATTLQPYLLDAYVYAYDLTHPADDDDGDGLSNYAEYLISEVFQFTKLDPRNPKTDGYVTDYHRKCSDLYLGEIFTNDHKDDDEDDDGDGWCNRSERMSGTDPASDGSFPVPEVSVAVNWYGAKPVTGPVVVQSWCMQSWPTDQSVVTAPDCTWTTAGTAIVDRVELYLAAGDGHVREGDNRFTVFMDENGDGTFTPGEPFAFVTKADIGYLHGEVEVTLDRTSPVFFRVNILDPRSNDRHAVYGDADGMTTNNVTTVYSGGRLERVRVVRTALNGIEWYKDTTIGTTVLIIPNRVVLDKYIDLGVRSYLHEGDILASGSPDLDWDTLYDDIAGLSEEAKKAIGQYVGVTNVSYRIVLGEGSVEGMKYNNVLSVNFVRRFDQDGMRHRATTASRTTAFNGPYPAFRWTMDGYDTYDVFRIVVTDDTTKQTVYDTGYHPAPVVRTENGVDVYRWTCDAAAGDVFPNTGTFTWKVSMYNAKFREDEWSDEGKFTLDVNPNGLYRLNGYDALKASVKYAGSDSVFDYGTVRLQAYTSTDCSGRPVAATMITNATDLASFTNFVDNTANVRLVGAPANGYPFYVMAYIDMNGNGVRDAFESYGIGRISTFGEVAGIWIEDADTNQNWLPDAWEFANAKNKSSWDSAKKEYKGGVLADSKVALSAEVTEKITAAKASFGGYLSGAPIDAFQNENFSYVLFGEYGNGNNYGSLKAYIDAAVKTVIKPSTLRVEGFVVDVKTGDVRIDVRSDVQYDTVGERTEAMLSVGSGGTADAAVRIYRKGSLVDDAWELFSSRNVSISPYDRTVTVSTGITDMWTNGVYRVTVNRR